MLHGFKNLVLATLRCISRILTTPLSLALLNAYIERVLRPYLESR